MIRRGDITLGDITLGEISKLQNSFSLEGRI